MALDACLFTDNRAGSKGDALYSFASANLAVVESAFDQQGCPIVDSVFYVAQGLPNNSTISRAEIRCPAGFLYLRQLSPQYSVPLAPWGSLNARSEVLKCKACPRDQYALIGGRLEADGSIRNVTCLECPGQADCSRGGADVYSLPGYWCGEASRSMSTSPLACTACPPGYCFADEPRPWHAACVANREGPMCGKCAPGHGEAFGIDECVPDQECLAVAWLLPAITVGVAYVVLVVWLPINHHPLWKSITYFMQTVPLVSSPDNVLLRVTMAVFALDPSVLGIHVTACPWTGLTAVEKMAAGYVLPAMLLVELAVMLGGHRAFRWLQGQLPHRGATRDDRGTPSWSVNAETDDGYDDGEEERKKDGHSDADRAHGSEYARYAGALTALVLLMYEGVTSATMDLLNCVPWDGALRLFRAGYVTCYAEWQYPLFVLLGGFLVPFPFLLVGLRRWLSSQQRRRDSSAWGWAVLHVLEGPYVRGRAWWESVGMLRRLALLAVATFVPDPMWRALGLAAGCFVVLLSHAYLRPYADRYYGWAETLFLCDLTLVAVLQIPQATFATLGQPFEGAAAEVVAYLQEALALLPLAFCAYVLMRRYGPPLLDWLWCKRSILFRSGEEARDAGDQEGHNKPHRRQAADDDEERLLSDDGAEAGAEDEDEASMHHSNEDSPSLAELVELQVGRFSQFLDAPSL